MANIVTFDIERLLIIEIGVVASPLTSPEGFADNVSTMQEIYSEWKEFAAQTAGSPSTGSLGIPIALRKVGGDPTSETEGLGETYFLMNGWRFKGAEGHHRWQIDGNVFTDPAGQSISVPVDGPYTVNVENKVSNLIDGITALSTINVTTEATNALVEDIHGQVRRAVFVNTEALVNGNGYQQTPFNNWTDAVDFAEANVLNLIYLEEDATLDRQLTNFEIIGVGLPSIDLNVQKMNGTIIRECDITGEQGDGALTNTMFALTCNLTNVSEFNGAALTNTVVGTLGFRNGTNSLINELAPFVAGGTITLDLTPESSPATSPIPGSTVAIQNASGEYNVVNMDSPNDSIHITMRQGAVTIDSSCTEGLVVIAGHANVTDNSGPNCTVQLGALIQPDILHSDVDLIRAVVAGDAVVSPDDLTVTVYANESPIPSPRTIRAQYSISADGRIRDRIV